MCCNITVNLWYFPVDDEFTDMVTNQVMGYELRSHDLFTHSYWCIKANARADGFCSKTMRFSHCKGKSQCELLCGF